LQVNLGSDQLGISAVAAEPLGSAPQDTGATGADFRPSVAVVDSTSEAAAGQPVAADPPVAAEAAPRPWGLG
jgi:hypothetical protein